MGTPPGEGEVGGRMREAVEECEEGVRRLRRRAVWLLLVAGAGDMALEHLGYLTSVSCVPGDARGLSGVLHGSISNSREGRASGAGLGSWEGAVEQMVARSCYLCAVHQRLHLTPDWVTTATTGVSMWVCCWVWMWVRVGVGVGVGVGWGVVVDVGLSVGGWFGVGVGEGVGVPVLVPVCVPVPVGVGVGVGVVQELEDTAGC